MDHEELLYGLEQVKEYKESHPEEDYEIELVRAAPRAVFGVKENGDKDQDLLEQMFVEPFE